MHHHTTKILFLDDNILEHAALKRELSANPDLKVDIEFYRDGQTFLTKAKDFEGKAWDAVILDIDFNTDAYNGRSLIKNFKHSWPDTPIIMRSVLDDPDTVLSCLSAGADEFVSKNSDQGALGKRLGKIVKNIQRKKGVSKETDGGKPQKLTCVGHTMRSIEKRMPGIVHSAIRCVHVNG